ncbi:MAG: MMPL family transporter, partial [Actinomycetota bacterium]|nr:MMPL family transporter [Actinomycetota bacterium]
MPGLSTWAVRRPVIALISWFIVLIGVVGLGATVGGKLNDSFSLPETESTTAQALLESALGKRGAQEAGANIIWSPQSGSAVDPAVLAKINPVLKKISELKSVDCVTVIGAASYGPECAVVQAMPSAAELAQLSDEQKAALTALAGASAPVSKDGTVAYSSINFAGENGQDLTAADAKIILDEVKALNSDALTVAASGQTLEFAGAAPPSSELFGILAAIIILLIAFGSLIAAGLPIIAAIFGLAMGQLGVLIAANFLDVATFAPTLAAMIGLGVGIDYSLFVINRYRQALLAGHAPKKAAQESVETAGRAVLFAAGTVVIALLGLFVLRINFAG